MLGGFMSPKSRKRRLLINHCVELFWLISKTYLFRGIPFRFVPFRASELALPRKSECLGMNTFFRGITETVPSLFRGIFSEQNYVPNPSTVMRHSTISGIHAVACPPSAIDVCYMLLLSLLLLLMF
jgi:hypothetical protein